MFDSSGRVHAADVDGVVPVRDALVWGKGCANSRPRRTGCQYFFATGNLK